MLALGVAPGRQHDQTDQRRQQRSRAKQATDAALLFGEQVAVTGSNSVTMLALQRFSRPLSEQSALRERIPAEGIIRVAHRYCKPLQELLLDLLALQRLLRAALRRDGGTQLNHRICVPVW